jgi:excisionase family DNA binding protein
MFVPVSQAARELLTSTQTIRKLIREGRVPYHRFGPKSTRVSIDHLRAMNVPTTTKKTKNAETAG